MSLITNPHAAADIDRIRMLESITDIWIAMLSVMEQQAQPE